MYLHTSLQNICSKHVFIYQIPPHSMGWGNKQFSISTLYKYLPKEERLEKLKYIICTYLIFCYVEIEISNIFIKSSKLFSKSKLFKKIRITKLAVNCCDRQGQTDGRTERSSCIVYYRTLKTNGNTKPLSHFPFRQFFFQLEVFYFVFHDKLT